MIEAEFLLELLMGLFADPARLDGASELLERCVGRKIREIVFAFTGRAMLADDPDLFTREMLGAHIADALRRAIGNPNADSGEACREAPLGAAPPTHRPPSDCLQHCLRSDRLRIGDMAPSRATTSGNGKDHRHVCGIDLLLERNADGPGEAARGERLPEGALKP